MEVLLSQREASLVDADARGARLIPPLSLMERAASAAHLAVLPELEAGRRVLYAAGPGNNGGDALAMARMAHAAGHGGNIAVLLVPGRETEERKAQRKCCEALGVPVSEDFEGFDVIVDGCLGAGKKGPNRPEADEIAGKINASGAKVYSLDVPSGFSDDAFSESVRADVTITFGKAKRSLYAPGNRELAGEIITADPGFPPESYSVVPSDAHLASFKDDYHPLNLSREAFKGSRGRVAVVGGSPEYVGAARLAARAAFAAGAGMVTVYTHPAIIELVASCCAGMMVRPYADMKDLSGYDAVLAGCGLGRGESSKAVLEQVISLNPGVLVLDADALRLWDKKGRDGLRTILTPHLGEWRCLLGRDWTGPEDYFDSVLAFAGDGVEVAVKGSCVTVSDGKTVEVVDGSNPSLGVAGSGDVLAGAVLAAAAAGGSLLDAVLLHQEAGRLAHEALGFYAADDLLPFIGRAR